MMAGSGRLAALLLTAAALAACTSTSQKPGGAGPGGTWYSPPAEYPGICMTLNADGKLTFAGGFAFYNPGSWTQDAVAAEVTLELGGSGVFPAEVVRQQLARRKGNLLRADAGKRTLVYSVLPETETIEVGGFVFHRALACEQPAKP